MTYPAYKSQRTTIGVSLQEAVSEEVARVRSRRRGQRQFLAVLCKSCGRGSSFVARTGLCPTCEAEQIGVEEFGDATVLVLQEVE